MTGHGQSSIESESLSVHLEIRTINNRFFKVAMTNELPAELQSSIEEAIRKRVTRGTVNVRVQIAQQFDTSQFRLNQTALEAYRKQLAEMGLGDSVSTDALLMLPGVVAEQKMFSDIERIWPVVEQALSGALDRLDEMRRIEGSAMAESLRDNLRQLDECMRRIDILAPKVVEQFSQRLTERINTLLQKHDVSVQASDVVREIGIFAERADIAEEIVRLRSHCDLFSKTMQATESNGRKLDFVVQEMLRETNTIGSKCGDAEMATVVVDMKTTIERMREMVQNVE